LPAPTAATVGEFMDESLKATRRSGAGLKLGVGTWPDRSLTGLLLPDDVARKISTTLLSMTQRCASLVCVQASSCATNRLIGSDRRLDSVGVRCRPFCAAPFSAPCAEAHGDIPAVLRDVAGPGRNPLDRDEGHFHLQDRFLLAASP
jgi:hypothetical protein